MPVHLVLAILMWRRKKWATYALLAIALDGNYTRDADMIPYVSVAIVINLALAISLWLSRRDAAFDLSVKA